MYARELTETSQQNNENPELIPLKMYNKKSSYAFSPE